MARDVRRALIGSRRGRGRLSTGSSSATGRVELALRRQYDSKLRTLSDARLIAEDIVWRKLLDANAMIKAQTRVDPSIGEAFSFLGDALRSEREAQEEDTEEPEPGVG